MEVTGDVEDQDETEGEAGRCPSRAEVGGEPGAAQQDAEEQGGGGRVGLDEVGLELAVKECGQFLRPQNGVAVGIVLQLNDTSFESSLDDFERGLVA